MIRYAGRVSIPQGNAEKVEYAKTADIAEKNLSVVDLKATEDGCRLYQSVGFVDDVPTYHLMKFTVR